MKGFTITIAILAIILAGFATVVSLEKVPGLTHAADSAVSVAKAEAAMDVSFTSPGELVIFRDVMAENQEIDKLFLEMPEDVLVQVASVLLKRDGHVTKKSVISEYKAGRNIYDNLKPPSEEYEALKADPPSTALIEDVSYSMKDTIINGKPQKLKVKTVRHYETSDSDSL